MQIATPTGTNLRIKYLHAFIEKSAKLNQLPVLVTTEEETDEHGED